MAQEISRSENSFAGRIGRYARVGTAMSGLAARMAGDRFLGIKIEREEHARKLKAALGGLKGPLMKVAQLAATIPEALPEEYARELRQLQTNAPPMGWSFVKRRMATELGRDWQSRFAEFSHAARCAASLGQVHEAVSPDGTRLACKLQYPDMGSAVEADLKQLKVILSIFERYDRAIRTDQIHAELGDRLREELDYAREARHMALYRDMLEDEPSVAVPDVLFDLSTDRLLTMSWLEGAPIMDFIEHDLAMRNQLAVNLFRAWYIPLYYYGVIHGDPHMGNYTVRPDGGINLLDFGCVRVFRPQFVQGVIDLYHALERDDLDLAVHAYEIWGFTGLTRETIETLNVWARFLYGAVMEDKERLLGETHNGVYGRETAEKVHRSLRESAAGVTVPREFVFMDRAALGLGSVFIHLKAEINWHRLFNEMIEGFDAGEMGRRQTEMLTRHAVPLPG